MIEVGANCKRMFLVYVPPPSYLHACRGGANPNPARRSSAIAVHSLAAVMLVLAFYGGLMGVVHHRLRRRFTIPEHYGTIATGFLLTVDPEVGEELQQAAVSKAGSIPRALADCRFAMDVQTGRVGMTRVPALCARRSRLRRVCSWLGRLWRTTDAGVGKAETETAETASTAVSAYGRSGSQSTVATAV